MKLGLVGLMVSSMMAALMSTADALMLTVSGLIHTLGFDLTDNPYAMNESIRMLIRLFFPFVILIFVVFVVIGTLFLVVNMGS